MSEKNPHVIVIVGPNGAGEAVAKAVGSGLAWLLLLDIASFETMCLA